MQTEPVHRAMRTTFSILMCASLLFVIGGCASLPPQPPTSTEDIAWAAAGSDVLPTTGSEPMEEPATLLRVTEPMRAFAQNAIRGQLGIAGKMNALAHAMTAPDGLHIQYDVEATLSAEQAFIQRRANCLTYTMLFIALAREVGVPANFNEVDIPAIWDLGDEQTSLLYLHVNARIDLAPPFFQIVDVSGDEYDPSFAQRLITNLAAEAQFYNNRAVELRLQRRYVDALRYQVRALQLSPETAYLWSNLADLYLVSGHTNAARIAVARALALDASSMLSYDTAAQIYKQLGEHRLADYFHDRAQYFLDQNPYYHYQLALAALREHDDHHVYNETRRAIELYPKDPRFYFLLAAVLDELGQAKMAGESLQTAILLTPDEGQQQRYKSKFARLTKQS